MPAEALIRSFTNSRRPPLSGMVLEQMRSFAMDKASYDAEYPDNMKILTTRQMWNISESAVREDLSRPPCEDIEEEQEEPDEWGYVT